ncbi:MAG: zinc metallopeptidase [Arenicellales bacterium]
MFSLVVENRLHATQRKWGSTQNSANMTGAEAARAILSTNDIRQVVVLPVQGTLTNHYDPRDKLLHLSEAVFDVPSLAALAIAAHETGHAVQDKVAYKTLVLRTVTAPRVNAAARFGMPAAILGMLLNLPILI